MLIKLGPCVSVNLLFITDILYSVKSLNGIGKLKHGGIL